VRLAHLPDSNLVATHLGEVRRVLCASPAYLERAGTPETPADLSGHACIMSNEAAAEPWSFAHEPGNRRQRLQAVSIHPRLIVNAAAAAIDSALDGHGITRVMSYQVAADVAAGRLKLILVPYEPPPIPVHFVMQSSRSVTAKLRSFIDFAAPSLRVGLTHTADLIGADAQIGPGLMALPRGPCKFGAA
jgi:DNA-binding transcriptional LysR family regulator